MAGWDTGRERVSRAKTELAIRKYQSSFYARSVCIHLEENYVET